MKVTRTEEKRVKLDSLKIGEVFRFPSDERSIYMVLNKHDLFLDDCKIAKYEAVFVDIVDGGIYTAHEDADVIELHGSFVLTEN